MTTHVDSKPALARGRALIALLVAVTMLAGSLALTMLSGCRREKPFWSQPAPGDLPAEVAAWVANSRPLFAKQTMAFGDVTYALIGLGRQPETASLEMVAVEPTPGQAGAATVTVRLDRKNDIPGEGQPAVYPQALAAISLTQAEVTWVVEGDPEAWLPSVLAPVEPIVAESDWIKVFSPAPDALFPPGSSLRGLANVFEGTVNYRLVLEEPGGGGAAGGDGSSVVAEGYATGAMGDWGGFETSVSFPAELSGKGAVLEVFWMSPMDGSERDKIGIPLVLGG